MGLDVPAFLAGVNGFSLIEEEDLARIGAGMTLREWKPGEVLIRRGDVGDAMHIIVDGRVRVPVLEPGGGTKMVVHLGPKDLVGEMALLTGERRTADVIAEDRVRTLVVESAVLQPMLREFPGLARFLTEILGKRLEQGSSMQLVGKYRLLGKIGEGATSRVYQGLHPELGRIVAIKMLSHALVYDQGFRDRFLQEARTIAGLVHPNIVQIYDTESAYATYFIVMEMVAGTDLAKVLKQRRVLDPPEAMDILRQVAQALSHAHQQGIVHRDVKPANCAIDKTGTVKLMDFGIARRVEKQDGAERAKVVEGTPRYLAPEAAVGRSVDGRADIYALGVMAFEMVTGRVPFYSETIRELLQMHVRKPPPDITRVRAGLPDALVSFINGALIKRPDDRMSDWERIISMLGSERAAAPDIRPRELSTELVTISYPPDAAGPVRRAVETLMVELATTSGVELGHARVVPVSVSAAAADPAPPPSEASPTPAPLPEPPSVWASRLTGGNSGAPRVEREKPDATRAMKPQ